MNENVLQRMLGKIRAKTAGAAKNFLKKSWDETTKTLKNAGLEEKALDIINKGFKTNFTSLDQIGRMPIKESVNEDFKHWWEVMKMEGFPTLAFYPALTAWIEIGKLLEPDQAVNWTKFGVYALLWVGLVTGKYLKGFFKWKKEHPEEFLAERPKKAARLKRKAEKLRRKAEKIEKGK